MAEQNASVIHLEALLDDAQSANLLELAEIKRLNGQLAECYRLSGADTDGNEDWRLAPRAVEEVKRLREQTDAEIDRLQRENAELRGLATDEARRNESLREEIEDLEAKLAAAEAAAMAYQQLSMCYRIGKRPTEKLFKQLENANKVCAAIDAAKGDKGK